MLRLFGRPLESHELQQASADIEHLEDRKLQIDISDPKMVLARATMHDLVFE